VTKGIKSIKLGFRLLQVIVEARDPLSLKSVSALSEMSASKARGYLISFIETGLVAQSPDKGLYTLGPYALRLATRALQRMDLMTIASDALMSLHRQTHALVLLGAWDGKGVGVVSRSDAGRPQTFLYQIGATASLANTATGRLFLAFGPQLETWNCLDSELAGLGIPKVERRRRVKTLEGIAAKIRNERFAEVDPIAYEQGSTLTGYAAVAAPVFDNTEQLRYALTVVYSTDGPASRRQQIIRLARQTADQVSHFAGSETRQAVGSPAPLGRA
jgi:DNA-binding IclR family transcriptional regulator